MATLHPAYKFKLRSTVVCCHPESVYYQQKGVVVDHFINKPTDVRVVVKWVKDGSTAKYRCSSLMEAPFRVKDNKPTVTQKSTETHKTTTKVYRIPARAATQRPHPRSRDL